MNERIAKRRMEDKAARYAAKGMGYREALRRAGRDLLAEAGRDMDTAECFRLKTWVDGLRGRMEQAQSRPGVEPPLQAWDKVRRLF
ncbi:MAG TPA: hypothetical protein PKB11_02550 [Desulfovibrio sp.]|jgi:hypothetical protein|uniref:hypothetical protein n=1 Tax=Desulfovibrio TaxID=872 RepID=UPI002A44DBCE|nr:hypothetical protein [Desulfovibrio sp.]MDY0305347.1 hypothetical protein [Desulfovibrionaceae bacterium]HMM37615.1 hypothetical protein [Desulfovibrio sp.]